MPAGDVRDLISSPQRYALQRERRSSVQVKTSPQLDQTTRPFTGRTPFSTTCFLTLHMAEGSLEYAFIPIAHSLCSELTVGPHVESKLWNPEWRHGLLMKYPPSPAPALPLCCLHPQTASLLFHIPQSPVPRPLPPSLGLAPRLLCPCPPLTLQLPESPS